VLRATSFNIGTDCTLVGGDSGGPLFDLDGKVIGIHSSIGSLISSNNHVPVDTYRETWDRLVKAEQWGGFSLGGSTAYLGVTLARGDTGLKVTEVTEDSPAAKAGFKADDVISKFDGQKLEDSDELRGLLSKKKPGDEVAVEVLRGGEAVPLKVKLGKRG
jgi:serine protease Do